MNKQNLDDNPYTPESLPLFNALYGEHAISLGGDLAIENMFSDLKLDGQSALDIGFGLGGVAFYLAQHYQMHVSGVELQPWMVEHAQRHAPSSIKDMVAFYSYDADFQLPFAPATFDLVYSKGVLNHVALKQPLFAQVKSVLKQAGMFVIADWIVNDDDASTQGPIVSETKASYTAVLQQAGFSDITFRDDSAQFIQYVEQLLDRLAKHKALIENQFGHDVYTAVLEQHQSLIAKINAKRKFAVRIVAYA